MSSLLVVQLLARLAVSTEIDRICSRETCDFLTIRGGAVRYIEKESAKTIRDLNLGRYVASVRSLVPINEAPVHSFGSPRGWRIVVSAFLARSDMSAGLRVRFFNSSGAVRSSKDLMMGLDDARMGRFFGDEKELFAITTEEEHSYNVSTELWLLPDRGDPAPLLSIRGTIDRFVGGPRPGVWIYRETYDGVHSETKGQVLEFWKWDRIRESLSVGSE